MTSTVAYVGNFEPEWSTENDVRKAFEHLGWDVIRLQENKTPTSVVRSVAHDADMLLWTSTWDDAHDLDAVRDMVHELVVSGVPTATYHLDTFWTTSRGGRKWWLNPMFLMGDVFTADGNFSTEWAKLGVRHHWLRPGVRHDACHPGKFNERYACDVAFVGSNGRGYHEDVWTYRKELVDELRAMCERNGWSWKNPGGDQEKVDRGELMNDFYASAKVTVGDSLCPRREDSYYWSDRAYEAPGRHGLLVMPQLDHLLKDFDDKLPMYPWGDFRTLEQIIGFLLEDDEYRDKIVSENAAVVVDSHTYVSRVETILESVL